MHELSIASSLVETVLDFVSEHQQIRRVLSVKLAIGEFSHVEEDQLRFCYEAITESTPIQGSTLEFIKIAAIVRCGGCGYQGAPKYWNDALAFGPVPTLECPDCGETVKPIEGGDCAIKTIRFATSEDAALSA